MTTKIRDSKQINFDLISPGQVGFLGATALTGDNNLFWDNTNKRLGIGTASPSFLLHAKFGEIRITGNDPINTVISFENTAGAHVYKLVGGVTGISENGFSIYDNTSVASRLIVFDSGGIAIGNTSDLGAGNLGLGGLIQFLTNATIPSGGGAIFKHTSAGLFIAGVTGSVLDFALTNPSGTAIIFTPTGTLNLGFAGLISTYNNIATVKNGVPSILASGRIVGQTSTVATVTSYAVPAVDSSFYVSGCITQNSGSGSITMPCTYTDEGGASISLNLAQITGIVAESNGTVFHLRVKASTTITIGTNVAGTVNYNAEAYISQIGV